MLERYLTRKILFFLFFFLFIPLAIVWVVQIRTIIDIALENHLSVWRFFSLSLYLIPPLLPHLVPLGFILASLYVIYNLHKESEWVVFWGVGRSVFDLAKPFLKISAFLSCVILVNYFWITPFAKNNFKTEIFLIKKNIIKSLLQPKLFQSPDKHFTFYMDNIRFQSHIEGFFIEDRSDPNVYRNFTAKEAYFLEEGLKTQLLLLKGRIFLIPTTDQAKPSMVSFDRFTLDVDLLGVNTQEEVLVKDKNADIVTLIQTLQKTSLGKEYDYLLAVVHRSILSSLTIIAMVFLLIMTFVKPLPPRRFPMMRFFMLLAGISSVKALETYILDKALSSFFYIYYGYGFMAFVMIIGVFYMKKVSGYQKGRV